MWTHFIIQYYKIVFANITTNLRKVFQYMKVVNLSVVDSFPKFKFLLEIPNFIIDINCQLFSLN